MGDKPIIAVVGATGAQGGGLVRAILADPNNPFQARALTRDPDSEQARELARLGAEVVAADVDDADSLVAAFTGAHGAFCVTFFWNHFSPEQEQTHARNLARAAKQANVPHVIWSTLEDTRELVPLDDDRMPTLMGSYKVPHFDGKGASDRVFSELGVPTTFLLTSFYWDNFVHFGQGPRPGRDGQLVLALPLGHAKLAGIAAEDIGGCAMGIFEEGTAFIGDRIGIAGEFLTGDQMAAAMSRALGRPVRYEAMDPDVYRGLGFPGAEDLGNMYQFYHEFEQEFCDARDIELSRALNPRLLTFDQWLARHKQRIPLEAMEARE